MEFDQRLADDALRCGPLEGGRLDDPVLEGQGSKTRGLNTAGMRPGLPDAPGLNVTSLSAFCLAQRVGALRRQLVVPDADSGHRPATPTTSRASVTASATAGWQTTRSGR